MALTSEETRTPVLTSEHLFGLNERWRTRFDFFSRHGTAFSKDFKHAAQSLPWRKRGIIRWNFFGMIFGPIYFLVLGLWKEALSIEAIHLGFIATLSMLGVEDMPIYKGISHGIAGIYAITANRLYYLKRIQRESRWNPFRNR